MLRPALLGNYSQSAFVPTAWQQARHNGARVKEAENENRIESDSGWFLLGCVAQEECESTSKLDAWAEMTLIRPYYFGMYDMIYSPPPSLSLSLQSPESQLSMGFFFLSVSNDIEIPAGNNQCTQKPQPLYIITSLVVHVTWYFCVEMSVYWGVSQ